MFSSRRLHRNLFALTLALTLWVFATPAGAATKLWLAWDPGTASCKAKVEAFFKCVLGSTNFNALAQGYPNGEPLTLAGSAVLSSYCAPTDFQCVVSNAGFAVTPYDVVVHYYGTSWLSGTNGTRTVTVGGQSVFINVAWIQTGASCDGQTCLGSHEAFEAATDGVSADCCNGQYHHTSCTQCQASCAQYDGNSGNPPWGCYDLTCPSGATYKMELLSKNQSVEYTASGCTKLTMQGCGGGGTALNQPCSQDQDCCSGLVCKLWDYDGQPPYSAHCCKDLGQSCSSNTDCCGGMNCTSGKCACVPDGQWCLNAGECCGGDVCDTSAHRCTTPPGTGGTSDASATGGTGTGGTGGTIDGSSFGGVAGALEGGLDSGDDVSPGGTSAATAPNPSSCGCTMPGKPAPSDTAWMAALALGLALLDRRAVAALSRLGKVRRSTRVILGGRFVDASVTQQFAPPPAESDSRQGHGRRHPGSHRACASTRRLR